MTTDPISYGIVQNLYTSMDTFTKSSSRLGGAVRHRKVLATSGMLSLDAEGEAMDYRSDKDMMMTTSIAAVCYTTLVPIFATHVPNIFIRNSGPGRLRRPWVR